MLTDAAVEALFRHAEVLTEGAVASDGQAERFFGSVMITIDLDAVRMQCRGLEAKGMLDRLLGSVEGSVRVRIRTHRLARRAVSERHPDRELGTVHIETRFSRQPRALLIDIDLEASLDVAWGLERQAR